MRVKIKAYTVTIFFTLTLFCNKQILQLTFKPQNNPYSTCLSSYQKTYCNKNQNAERFGFFSSKLWNHYYTNLFEHIQIFTTIPRYVLWYSQIDDSFPTTIIEQNNNLNIHTVISQDIKSTRFDELRNYTLLQEIVEGKWDKHFRSFAKDARKIKGPIYYRFGYEMNGNWFPWCEKPELFVQAWRRIWNLFHKEKAHNVQWIFCPSVLWDEKNLLHEIDPYYPGDMYVDIVAVDGYNYGDSFDKYHKWNSVTEIFSKSLAILETYNKPMWIAEVGCPTDPRRTQWLADFFDLLDSHCCIDVFIWFNENKSNEPDFRIESDSSSLIVFREWLQRKEYMQQEPNLITQRFPH